MKAGKMVGRHMGEVTPSTIYSFFVFYGHLKLDTRHSSTLVSCFQRATVFNLFYIFYISQHWGLTVLGHSQRWLSSDSNTGCATGEYTVGMVGTGGGEEGRLGRKRDAVSYFMSCFRRTCPRRAQLLIVQFRSPGSEETASCG